MSQDLAVRFVTTLERFPIQEATVELVHASLVIRERWRSNYWDAAIVETPRLLGCAEIYTEDLQAGQDFAGITIVNPFH